MNESVLHGLYGNRSSTVGSRFMGALLASALMLPALASAQYSIEVVLPPGALFAQTFGINNAGIVTGGADDGVSETAFAYDMKKGTYTTISSDFAALDINNNGVMVGDVAGVCAIRDKKGEISFFSPPSFMADSSCQGRGVNSRGDVSGFVIDDFGVWRGFVHDPKKGTTEEFLPSLQTFAHAINAQGQVAGSVSLGADGAYPGSPPGRYGYLREKNGDLQVFEVTPSFPGFTRARGVSESGLVAGFYLDGTTSEFKSFVTSLSGGTAFESVALSADEVIHQKPCDVDLPPPPGPGYELFTDFTASQVRNDGVVVGSCTDTYFNPGTGDLIGYRNGFIATPIK